MHLKNWANNYSQSKPKDRAKQRKRERRTRKPVKDKISIQGAEITYKLET